MKSLGAGKTYTSKVTGQKILLKYADKPKVSSAKPEDKISSSQYAKEREMARQNMAPAKAPEPEEKISPSQYDKEREMARQNMAPAKAPEPEFKGRMIPPSESGVGASSTPPRASFVNARKEMKQGGPMGTMTSSDFAKQPPSSLREEVTVGTNKYRIV